MTDSNQHFRPDRRVHARAGVKEKGHLWEEIVRYDRAGKWYIEVEGARKQVSLREAALRAVELEDQGGEILLGVTGGNQFDAAIRPYRARRGRA